MMMFQLVILTFNKDFEGIMLDNITSSVLFWLIATYKCASLLSLYVFGC